MLLLANRLSFQEKWTIIQVAWQVLRVNESGGLTMKVVAGSHGNDAIGSPTYGRRRNDGLSARVGSSNGRIGTYRSSVFRCRTVGCASSKVRRELRPFGAASHDSIAFGARRLRCWR